MDISFYFKPLDAGVFGEYENRKTILGNVIEKYVEGNNFPDVTNYQLAIIGIPEERGAVNNKGCNTAPDKIRQKFYELKSVKYPYKIVDLGNLILGEKVMDTYAAVSNIVSELLKEKIIPIILGGSQDITYAQYAAYHKIEETVNIVAVDAHFDLGTTEEPLNSNTYLGKIILHEPNFLYNFSNIGYQTYFAGYDQIDLMDKLYFDAYRLGEVRKDIEEVEPIVRNADIVSFDVGAIRQSDAPGNNNSTPNGFYGEEACQITRYAGLSDKLSSIGFYEINPACDLRGQTSHLVAQMLWYFIDGYYQRKKDVPMVNQNDYVKYRVNVLKDDSDSNRNEIIFFKSKKSERWWMEVPIAKTKFQRHNLVPCSYKDYEAALREEMPERWWQALQKTN
jgi:formiminoglutamase